MTHRLYPDHAGIIVCTDETCGVGEKLPTVGSTKESFDETKR